MKKRRFIAGAMCPKCREIDKLVTYELEDQKFRECVRCGFKEELRFENVANEIETRVNRPLVDTAEKVVRVVDIESEKGPTQVDPNRII